MAQKGSSASVSSYSVAECQGQGGGNAATSGLSVSGRLQFLAMRGEASRDTTGERDCGIRKHNLSPVLS